MIFTRGIFTRFLAANKFNKKQALKAVEDHVAWRQKHQVDLLLDHDFMGKEDAIREFMPTGFHEHDKEGRPLMIINAGQLKLADIMKSTTPDTVTKFIIRELEHTWREKFDRCEQISKQKVDQIRLVIDMRGATLKQIANKQLNLIWGELQRELSIRYPEFVHKIHIVNTPMFFEAFFNSEIKPKLTPV